MTAPEHNRLLGIFHLANGAIQAIATAMVVAVALFVPSLTRSFPAGDVRFPRELMTMVLVLTACILAMQTAVSILAGVGLLKRRGWARVLAIVAGILALLSFPLGTALGVYSCWFLLGSLGSELYRERASSR